MIAIDLSGRRALVTGGGSGIGEATAKRLADAGAAVAVADLFAGSAERVAAEIKQAGGMAVPVQVDVVSLPSVEAMYARCAKSLGGIDILVNNAGAWTIKWFDEIDPSEYRRDVDVCLFGAVNCSRVCLPGMVERQYGRIVSIISEAGRAGEPRMTLYSAAKAAVAGFTKALAREYGRHGITVNGVSPGATPTPGNVDTADFGSQRLIRRFPLRRLGTPLDQANAVLFFACDLSSWITGQILSVSGGYTMA